MIEWERGGRGDDREFTLQSRYTIVVDSDWEVLWWRETGLLRVGVEGEREVRDPRMT